MSSDTQHSLSSVEHVIKRFHTLFKDERAAFLSHIHGIATATDRERYASRLLNRLMFLYFLQKKGLLDGDSHYLRNRLHMLQKRHGENTFYRHFLLPLFHEGLDSPHHTPELRTLFGNVPYLDSNLFTTPKEEFHTPEIQIDDAAFETLFAFFDTYNWCLGEHLPQTEQEINPDILGHIFEKHINQQHMGAYYTKSDITEYIARNTIIPYLFNTIEQICPVPSKTACWQLLRSNPDRYIYNPVRNENYLPTETTREYMSRRTRYKELHGMLVSGKICTIDDLITYNLDICQFARDTIHSIDDPALLSAYYEQLTQLTILDPTCGSGAFLFAALTILVPLYEACIDRMQTLNLRFDDFQDLLDPLRQQHDRRYFLLKTIMSHNLYGVDIMEEATELCKLRFLLKLVAHAEHIEDIEPLPDLAQHIRTGNALIGFISAADAISANSPSKPSTHIKLDRALAREYAVDPNDPATFEHWRSSHRPFHWDIEFESVFQRGGFNVIIGNPPYVEYNEKTFSYTLRNFVTLPCSNLYTCVIERSRQLLSPQGRHGMILPLAAFATKNMIPFIEGFQRWFPCSWLSFYHFRPAMLFSGGKVASIPTTIYLARVRGPVQRFSTHVIKWSGEYRDLLFTCLSYCRITAPGDPNNRHYYPKFGSTLENAIMCKVLAHQQIRTYLASIPNQNRMFYRSAGGLYWKVFVNFIWPYDTTSNKQCAFQECYDCDVFVALFNSSLFWWYYTVTFDTFNLKDYMLFGFRFTYPGDEVVIAALKELCQQLMDDFRKHAQHLKRGETGSYTIYAKKSKHIIDAIDHILARHYGFTDEELDFIIHYDMKYRVGSSSSLHVSNHI